MKKPAVFFDRDNTLIVCDGFIGNPDDVQLMPGAPGAIARARLMGYATVTFSNQSGVGRGMFSEEDVAAVNKRMDELLRRAHPDAVIDRHEFCPFHPEATVEKYRQESDLRKPKPGMLLAAAKALDLNLDASWVIGDSPRDIEAGLAAGCPEPILLVDPSIPPSPAASEPSGLPPDETVPNLSEALDVIEAAQAAESAMSPTNPVDALYSAPRRRPPTPPPPPFSFPKMLAGVTQILALLLLWHSLIHPEINKQPSILFALFVQILTITLLMMGADSGRR